MGAYQPALSDRVEEIFSYGALRIQSVCSQATGSLLQPLKTGAMELPNRTAIAPIWAPANEEGYVTDAKKRGGLLSWASRRTEPGGLAVRAELALWDDRYIPGLARLVEAVHRHGVTLGIELGHGGVQNAAARKILYPQGVILNEAKGPVVPEALFVLVSIADVPSGTQRIDILPGPRRWRPVKLCQKTVQEIRAAQACGRLFGSRQVDIDYLGHLFLELDCCSHGVPSYLSSLSVLPQASLRFIPITVPYTWTSPGVGEGWVEVPVL